MELFQAGVDRALIAIWLGHESLDTTQIYLDANLQLKEAVLEKLNPVQSKPGRYRPDDQLLSYLKGLCRPAVLCRIGGLFFKENQDESPTMRHKTECGITPDG